MKKTMYIPGGETVEYENLTCCHITVNGELCVKGTLTADSISGNGKINAETICVKTVRAGVIDATMIVADAVLARQLYAAEVRALDSVIASTYIEAELVKTRKLIIADAEIQNVVAVEVTKLSPRRHSILGVLFLSFLRSVWLSLFGGKNAVGSASNERKLSNRTQAQDNTENIAVAPEVVAAQTETPLEDALEIVEDTAPAKAQTAPVAIKRVKVRIAQPAAAKESNNAETEAFSDFVAALNARNPDLPRNEAWSLGKPIDITAEDFDDVA